MQQFNSRVEQHLLLLLSLLLSTCSTVCPPPYQSLTRPSATSRPLCVHANWTAGLEWCQAASQCAALSGGRLASDIYAIRAARAAAAAAGAAPGDNMWTGVTDLLVERGVSRLGWQTVDGDFPSLDDTDWIIGRPNGNIAPDDFLAVGTEGFTDKRAVNPNGFVCQLDDVIDGNYRKLNSYTMMRRADFLRLGDISPSYCYTEATNSTVRHWLDCLRLCVVRKECRATVFNAVLMRCRMLDYADASVGNVIEMDTDWVKFVKTY